MTEDERTARMRYLLMALSRLFGAAGAVMGLILMARGAALFDRLVGFGLTVSALWVMAVLPRALAARWRSGE